MESLTPSVPKEALAKPRTAAENWFEAVTFWSFAATTSVTWPCVVSAYSEAAMSGIEIVGIAMAVAPLVISTLEHYKKRLKTFKIWLKYEADVALLCDAIELEKAKFLNTTERLLRAALPPSQVLGFSQTSYYQKWISAEVQTLAEHFLGPSAQPFYKAARRFHNALESLQSKLRMRDPDLLESEEKSRWDQEIDRIKYAVSRERRYKLKHALRDANNDMRELVTESVALLPPLREASVPRDLQRVRDAASGVYNALEGGPWGCQQTHTHHANLRLDKRVQSSLGNRGEVQLQIRFRVLFHQDEATQTPTASDWRETDIVALDDRRHGISSDCESRLNCLHPPKREEPTTVEVCNKPKDGCRPSRSFKVKKGHWSATMTLEKRPEKVARKSTNAHQKGLEDIVQRADHRKSLLITAQTLKPIVNLCAALRRVAEGNREGIGCLVGGQVQQFSILPVRCHPPVPADENIIPLNKLLDTQAQACDVKKAPYELSWRDRRYLAVCLASSLLQLYNTPWLNHRWGRQDICFLRQLTAAKNPLIQQQFISKAISPQRALGGPDDPQALSLPSLIRNPAVFDLGILLIELCFRKPLRAFWDPDDLRSDGTPNKFTNLTTAERLLPRVYGEAGVRYGDAVRRCIRCEFDQRENSLEDEEFRHAFYTTVVLPLEDDLRDFCGGDVPAEP